MRLPRRVLPLAMAVAGAGAMQASAQVADAGEPSAEVDLVVVHKAARQLILQAGGRVVRTYDHIQLGEQPVGPKHFQGDGRTPEGRYTIDYGNPSSSYHLSLHITYPDSRDTALARAAGRAPGGQIFIHGQPNGTHGRVTGDWTDGCIALDDAEIEELWELVPDGTPIEIGH
ncbi:L,D-transpeptidase family protein [Novosphingobium lentum]|uniref:L,D-transpeptidase family protein n=1 Tax=Novosphingobium lentum TaxID=145287 RepID=UPI00082B591B|nr:L,D-transpeptidase family protein [Novosphingobium lentum]